MQGLERKTTLVESVAVSAAARSLFHHHLLPHLLGLLRPFNKLKEKIIIMFNT